VLFPPWKLTKQISSPGWTMMRVCRSIGLHNGFEMGKQCVHVANLTRENASVELPWRILTCVSRSSHGSTCQ
jgi:hypothetical protein